MLAFAYLIAYAYAQDAAKRLTETGRGAADQTTKQKEEWHKLNNEISKTEVDFVASKSAEYQQIQKNMKASQNTQNKFDSDQGVIISKVTKEAVTAKGGVDQAKAEATAATEEEVDEMETTANDFASQITANEEDQNEKVSGETEKLLGMTEDMRESGIEALAGAADAVSGETDELKDKIKEATKSFETTAKEQSEVQKDILKTDNDNIKGLKKSEKLVDKTVGKIETRLDSATTQIDRMKTEAGKKASAAATKSVQVVVKGQNDVAKTADSELRGMKSSNEALQKALESEIDQAVKEGDANMAEAEKEASQTEKNTNKNLDAALSKLTTDDEKMETLQEKASEDADAQLEKLVTVENGLSGALRKASAAGTDMRNAMVAQTQTKMESMKEGAQAELKAQDGKVQAENNQRINSEMGEIQSANKYVGDATASIADESSRLEEEINTMTVESTQAQSGVEAIKGSIESEEKRTEQMVNEQKSSSIEALEEGKANLQEELEQAGTLVQSTAASAKRQSTADLKSVQDDMAKKVEDVLVGQGRNQLAAMQRTTASVEQSASELVAKMQGELGSISQKKKDVEGRIPSTAEVITAAEQGIEQNVDGVRKSIKDSSDKEEQLILSSQQKNRETFTKQITDVENSVRSKTAKDADATERSAKSLEEEADTLKTQSSTDFANEEKDVSNLRQDTTSALMRAKGVKEKADQESMALRDGIETIRGDIQSVTQQENRRTKEMGQNLQTTVLDAFGTATSKTKTTIEDAMKGEEVKLTKFVQDAESGFESDEMSAQEYSNQAENKLKKIGDDVEHLRQILEKNKIDAVSEDQALQDEMTGYMKSAEGMAQRRTKETAAEKERLEQALRKMQEGLTGQVNQIQASEQESLGQVKQEASAYQTDEADRLQVEKTKVQSAVKLHENRVAAQLQRVDGSVSKSAKTLKAFEEGENDAESKYGAKVSELDSEITTSDDSVNKAVRDEDQAVAGTMNNEIGDLEGLMGQLQGVEKGANSKIGDMKATFKDELAYFANAGNAKSNELESKLKHVEDSSVDLVGQFKADTEASQNELAATQGRLGKVVNSTMAQMDSFKERLAEIRKSRETEAIKLHNDISDVKGELFNVLNGTTTSIEMMKTDTAGAYKRMAQEQKEFDRMLVNASMMTSDHDDDKIQELAKVMYALESNHSRLMGWQKQFKHYTGAWREEVKRKLQELTGSVSSDEDQIAAGRLHSELSMQEGMRGLQKSVEGEVVDAVGKEAASVNSLVNNVRADMDNVFTKSDHEEEAKTQALQMTKVELKNAQDASNTEMGKIKEAEGALNDKSNEFKNELAAAKDAISGTLVLPQESASAKNVEYNRQYTALQGRIAQLESQQSGFLQTGEHSLAVGAQGEAAEQREVAALTALNSQLRSENSALSQEDDKLEAQVTHIVERLKAAGIPVNL